MDQQKDQTKSQSDIENIEDTITDSKDSTSKEKQVEGSEIKERVTRLDKIKSKARTKLVRLNDLIESTLKNWKDFLFNTTAGRILLITVLFFFITIPIIMVMLGFDNYIFRSSLTGTVYTENQELIEDAEIKIQDKTVVTDDKGRYEISDLDYGRWEIVVNANGFAEYREEIDLQRFQNTLDIELIPLDFGELQGKLLAGNDPIFDQATIKINDQELSLDEEGAFETGRILTGEYELIFESPYYKDFKQDINVRSGRREIEPIILQKAGDIVGVPVDFLNGEELGEIELSFDLDNQVFWEDDKFTIRDLEVDNEISFELVEDDYKTRDIQLSVDQGINDLEDIFMVREGEVYSYFGDNIVYSDLDGENYQVITEDLSEIQLYKKSGENIYFFSGNDLYVSSKTSSPTLLYSGIKNTLDRPLLSGGFINVGITEEGVNVILHEDSDESTILFENPLERVTSWLAGNRNEYLYFSTDKAVYRVKIDGSEDPQKLTDGVFYLQDINSSDVLLALNYTNSSRTQSNIWKIYIDKQRERITPFSENFLVPKYIDENTLLYLKSGDLYISNSRFTNERKLADDVINFIYNPDNSLITYAKLDGYHLVDLSGNKFEMDYKK